MASEFSHDGCSSEQDNGANEVIGGAAPIRYVPTPANQMAQMIYQYWLWNAFMSLNSPPPPALLIHNNNLASNKMIMERYNIVPVLV